MCINRGVVNISLFALVVETEKLMCSSSRYKGTKLMKNSGLQHFMLVLASLCLQRRLTLKSKLKGSTYKLTFPLQYIEV